MIDIDPLIKRNITIPNILSLMRIILIFPFIMYIKRDNYVFSGIILLFSGLTDLLDGFIARNFNQKSKLGEMLDPAADKITLIAVMISVGMKFTEVIPFMILLVLKEVSMLLASAMLLKRRKFPTAAQWYGKIGTVVFYFSVIIIVSLKAVFGIENIILNMALMTITALLMIYALVKYFKIFIDMIKIDKKI